MKRDIFKRLSNSNFQKMTARVFPLAEVVHAYSSSRKQAADWQDRIDRPAEDAMSTRIAGGRLRDRSDERPKSFTRPTLGLKPNQAIDLKGAS
jgi:hypothetical protein